MIDGHCIADEVAQLFAVKYRDLFSRVSYDHADIAGIVTSVGNHLLNDSSASDCLVIASEVNLYMTKYADAFFLSSVGAFTPVHLSQQPY